MGKLQIAMSEEELKKAYDVLNKAKGKFLLEGKNYNYGQTILRILEEWSTNDQQNPL